MGSKDELRRLKKALRRDYRVLELEDGSLFYYDQEDLKAAFLNNYEILWARCDGREEPPPTPFQQALRRARYWDTWHAAYIDALQRAS